MPKTNPTGTVKLYLNNINDYVVMDTEDLPVIADAANLYAYRKKNDTKYYVRACFRDEDGKPQVSKQLHRMIMEAKPGETVTFRDHNPLNCTKDNLLIADRAYISERKALPYQQQHLRGVRKEIRPDGTVVYLCFFTMHGNDVHLGAYKDEIHAGMRYDMYMLQSGIELPRLNYPDVSYDRIDYVEQWAAPHKPAPYRGVCKYGKYPDRLLVRYSGTEYHNSQHIGVADSALEAAEMYDDWVREMLPPGSPVNFPKIVYKRKKS